jgi:uncharacterized protein (TIGR02246 family)
MTALNRAVPTAAVGIAIAVLLSLTVVPAQKATPGAPSRSFSASDQIEIQQLVRKYAWALDSGDNYGYAFADLFTPDGVFVGTNQGPDGRSYQGRDQLAALARGGARGATKQSHFTMNHVIAPTADGGVTGRAYVVIADVGVVGMPNAVNHGGHYDDVYEKTNVGWRFKRRTYWESKVDSGGVKP